MTVAAQPAPETRWYRMCGLTVESAVELPGFAAADAPSGEPDVWIRLGAVPEVLAGATRRGSNWEAAPGRLLLHAPGIARFLVRDGREAFVDPEGGHSVSELAVFIGGSVLAALLHQRGLLALHASAVEVDGQAVLFCGASGAGKSVLGAALSEAGHPLIADDACCIESNHDRPCVVPDGRRLKLWADTIGQLELERRRGVAVRTGIEKYWVEPQTSCANRRLPLRAIYFLQPARLPGSTGIEPLTLIDAMTLLRAGTFRRRLVRAFDREQGWLDGCADLARRVPSYQFTREMSFDALPDSVKMLECHWGH